MTVYQGTEALMAVYHLQEKERAQQRLVEEAAHAAAERWEKANKERLRINPPPKQLSSKTEDESKEAQRNKTVASRKTKSTTKVCKITIRVICNTMILNNG